MGDDRRKISIDWVQLGAGALTAVTSAVLLSTVGVAGTLIGAAVGSVLGTVGNAVYSHYLAMSRERVAAAKVLADARARDASARAARARVDATVGGFQAEHQLDQAEGDLQQARADRDQVGKHNRVSWREALSVVRWRRVLAVTAAVFVIAFGAILAFEALTGRAVSTYTGGSNGPARISIPGLDSGQPQEQQPGDERPRPEGDTPDGQGDEGPEQSPTPTTTTPASPTPTETPTQLAEPTTTPEPDETAEPSPSTGSTVPPGQAPAAPAPLP